MKIQSTFAISDRSSRQWRVAGLGVLGVALLIASPFGPSLHAQTGRGTICVVPNPTTRPLLTSPGGDYNPATLSVKFDKREAVLWPHAEPLKIEGLDQAKRHLVVLTSDGKRMQSFWFRFSDYKSDRLCLSFDGYQGPQLQREAPPYCRCK